MIVLFIAAGLVIGRVVFLIEKTFSSVSATKISTAKTVDYQDSNDFDHDGLDNGEEAVWGTDPYNPDTDGDGYLDGEEILSDHNPLLATNDALENQRNFLARNSTERLAQLITGGIISGELKSADPQFLASTVNDTAQATIFSILSALEDVDIPPAPSNLVSNTKENQEKYLAAIFDIIDSELTSIIFSQPGELVKLFSPSPQTTQGEFFDQAQKEAIKARYLQYALTFQQAADDLSNFSVPQDWTGIHQKIIVLLKKLEVYHRAIALATADPLKQLVVLGNLQNIYLEAHPILIAINTKIKTNQLSPPNSSFFDVSLLLNP